MKNYDKQILKDLYFNYFVKGFDYQSIKTNIPEENDVDRFIEEYWNNKEITFDDIGIIISKYKKWNNEIIKYCNKKLEEKRKMIQKQYKEIEKTKKILAGENKKRYLRKEAKKYVEIWGIVLILLFIILLKLWIK